MLLGAVIGFERESANKPAGLRTHTFVAGAAALLVALLQFTLAIGVTVLALITLRLVSTVPQRVSK